MVDGIRWGLPPVQLRHSSQSTLGRAVGSVPETEQRAQLDAYPGPEQGEGESEGKPVRSTKWVVTGYPTIKSVIRFDDGGEVVEVLKSFTRGTK